MLGCSLRPLPNSLSSCTFCLGWESWDGQAHSRLTCCSSPQKGPLHFPSESASLGGGAGFRSCACPVSPWPWVDLSGTHWAQLSCVVVRSRSPELSAAYCS